MENSSMEGLYAILWNYSPYNYGRLYTILTGRNRPVLLGVTERSGGRRHCCAGVITAVLWRQPHREETPAKYLQQFADDKCGFDDAAEN